MFESFARRQAATFRDGAKDVDIGVFKGSRDIAHFAADRYDADVNDGLHLPRGVTAHLMALKMSVYVAAASKVSEPHQNGSSEASKSTSGG